jgi:hypothetical protein
MTSDFGKIPSIASFACGKTVGGELAFTFPAVSEVIRLCTGNEIAVLGVEILEVRDDGYYTKHLSIYDQELTDCPRQRQEWGHYVAQNNALAEEFVGRNPTGDDHIYVLTTSSWEEFGQAQKLREDG